jgi:hypothetical protein
MYAFPLEEDLAPIYIIIKEGRLLPAPARLNKWHDDIYELVLEFRRPPCALPPIVTKELQWNGYLGLCGGYVVHENLNGTRRFFSTPVNDVTIFNKKVLAETNGGLMVLNEELEVIKEINPCDSYQANGTQLTVTFTPGDMDLFTVEQVYDEKFNLISTVLKEEKCVTELDRLRAFCQAVRLNLKDVAMGFITDTLKQETSFESIKEFLGIFDQTDTPRYLSRQTENAIALRYCIDKYNFHYMCYEFSFDATTGVKLIDDISEL